MPLPSSEAATGRAERERLIAAAEEDILATRRSASDKVNEDMGGPVWYDRYDELFQRIQRLAGQPGRWAAESVTG